MNLSERMMAALDELTPPPPAVLRQGAFPFYECCGRCSAEERKEAERRAMMYRVVWPQIADVCVAMMARKPQRRRAGR